jgi:hypothetical protein
MADGGPAKKLGKPGKRALCIEEGGQQGKVAEKQQETPEANKNVADSFVPGVVNTLKRGKIKWWKSYMFSSSLKAIFFVLSQ